MFSYLYPMAYPSPIPSSLQRHSDKKNMEQGRDLHREKKSSSSRDKREKQQRKRDSHHDRGERDRGSKIISHHRSNEEERPALHKAVSAPSPSGLVLHNGHNRDNYKVSFQDWSLSKMITFLFLLPSFLLFVFCVRFA